MESVEYGSKTINFKITRTTRKTLAIEVHPDSSVQLIAPKDSTLKELKGRVVHRGKWIVKQQAYFETFLPATPIREYVSGETHYYLGKRYLLKVEQGVKNTVKLTGGKIVVTLISPSQDKVKKMLASWYYRLAKRKFEQLMELTVQKFKQEKIEASSFEIKRMKKRWGSCTPEGKIILNPELIKANTKCIEYVITHELCHLLIPAHNKEFYKLLAEKMPRWERWKERLERLMA
ncbi:M48 family metallopeptidase [Aequorivita sp. F47161]|uniref:M48 family metallopeptidase n=1 Tax=Aequorivita vitellina TaxID=2874475 RepID=A0A9X1QYB9_9FLAO|nr:SprT family zinc-dependent metalloprotease [Aequorivita vitellina]MCG2420091.1 M48 family metallopeptidase [Aequorivita vitellina]